MNATLTAELAETKKFAQVNTERMPLITTLMIEKYIDAYYAEEPVAFKYGVMLQITASLLSGDERMLTLYREWMLRVKQTPR